MSNPEEKTLYKREAVEIAERRGWSAHQISCFLNYYDNMPKGYTVDMIDRFEYSVNGPVIGRNHPSAYREI